MAFEILIAILFILEMRTKSKETHFKSPFEKLYFIADY